MGRKKSAEEKKQLTARELKICMLIADDFIGKMIVDSLGIEMETLKTHKRNIRRKLGVNRDGGIVAKLFRTGQLS